MPGGLAEEGMPVRSRQLTWFLTVSNSPLGNSTGFILYFIELAGTLKNEIPINQPPTALQREEELMQLSEEYITALIGPLSFSEKRRIKLSG